jgi:surface antigen
MQATARLGALFLSRQDQSRTNMRVPKTSLKPNASSALIVAFVAVMLQAQGTGSLGRSMAELSASDREAMVHARREVLDELKPGAASSWKDEKTGHLGEAHLLRVYEKNGMTCGEVEHILKVPQARQYVTSFCRAGDGAWRAAY